MSSDTQTLIDFWTTRAPKAATGPGVAMMTMYPQLNSLSRNPQKLMAEAASLFHSNPWIGAAERTVSGLAGRVDYHLEDEKDDTLDAKSGPAAESLIRVIDFPSRGRTRRQLWSLTARHMGLCGNAFHHLDQLELLGNTPLEILYVAPWRMSPVQDHAGRLLAWVMDAPQNPMTPQGSIAVPFSLEEIIHFTLDEPDDGHWGIGIPESAQIKAELATLTDRHAAQVIASGGRMAGILAPKEGGALGQDQWEALVRDYRNIVGDNESAKRLQIVKQPVDFTRTVADPNEMQLPSLMTASRDDILALWGVPLSQLGIVPARGLNSGDVPKFEEAALWQGAVNARLVPLGEKIQNELVNRWEPHGLKATLELEVPEFDDEAPLYENAVKAVNVPRTVDEMRALVGLDPLEDEELGAKVYLAQTLVEVTAEPPAPPPAPFGGLGGPPVPGGSNGASQPIPEPVVQARPQDGAGGKAKADPLEKLQARTMKKWVPKIRATVEGLFEAERKEIAERISKHAAHIVEKPGDSAVWWNPAKEERRWRDALEPLMAQMEAEVVHGTAAKVARKADLDVDIAKILSDTRHEIGHLLAGKDYAELASGAALLPDWSDRAAAIAKATVGQLAVELPQAVDSVDFVVALDEIQRELRRPRRRILLRDAEGLILGAEDQ